VPQSTVSSAPVEEPGSGAGGGLCRAAARGNVGVIAIFDHAHDERGALFGGQRRVHRPGGSGIVNLGGLVGRGM